MSRTCLCGFGFLGFPNTNGQQNLESREPETYQQRLSGMLG